MEWTDKKIEVGGQLSMAIFRGQLDLCEKICKENPWIVKQDQKWLKTRPSWLSGPAGKGNMEMVAKLLELGFNPNALSGKEESTALVSAIEGNHYDLAKFLLKHGAAPNLSRPLIGAVGFRKPPELQLRFVKLLVENGCDVNRIYALYGDMSRGFTVLDRTSDPDVVAYLKSKGAKHSGELNKSDST